MKSTKKYKIFAQDIFRWDESSSGLRYGNKTFVGYQYAVSPKQAVSRWKWNNRDSSVVRNSYCEYGGESYRETILVAEEVA